MNNKNTSQLLICAAEADALRLGKMLKAGGGPYSTTLPDMCHSFTEIPAAVPEVALASIPYVNDAVEAWLAHYARTPAALVILTDNPDVADAARNVGVVAVAQALELSPAMLNSFIDIAQTVQNLKHYQTRVQGLYDMAEQRFADMAGLFTDWLWEVDTALNLTFSSSRKRPLAGARTGMPIMECFLDDERLRIEDDFAALIRAPEAFHGRDYWSADHHGTRSCWSLSGVPVRDGIGKLVGFRGIARDVSAEKANSDQLYYLVNNDPLTGLTNRSRFVEELARSIRAAKRDKAGGALVLLDIDHFAYINQTHGHGVGDKMLIHVGQVLKDSIRTGDMAARLDGDQFALLLRSLREEDVPTRLKNLQTTLSARPLHHEKGSLAITMSGGIALYPKDGTEADALLANGGMALHEAKQRGPNRMEVYHADMATQATSGGRLEWMNVLTTALDDAERCVHLHYQTIVPITGRLEGEHYEALARLVLRDGTIVPAVKFIEAAEEFGLINKLDFAVVSRAVKALKHYRDMGRPIHISVNLSAKTFEDDGLIPHVTALLNDANLPQGALVFELTETALLRDLPKVKALMAQLKALGAGLALDDCGVGYSSLNYIRQLDLDYIKIDGSFIRNLHNSPEDQVFVKALADLAKQKNMATVAEMVEHEATVEILAKLGVDMGQGFHFAPPAAELPERKR
ncbi:MAG: bifunctional diguanylate cyclase/phosphodiesterase [Alphaproteobacteria bacterium]